MTRVASADAAALGVHRVTLYRTLSGKTQNPRLLSRYLVLLRLRSKITNPTPHCP